MIKFLLVGIVLNFFVAAAEAASITTFTAQNGEEIIHLEGPIDDGDEFLLLAAIVQLGDKAKYLSLNSGGGYIDVGHKLEKLVEDYGLTTLINKRSQCLSACANLWLSGKEKIIANGSKLGFHVGYFTEGGLTNIINAEGIDALQQRVQILYSTSIDSYVYRYAEGLTKPYEFAFWVSNKGYNRGHFWYLSPSEINEHIKNVRIY